ncbi:hypothetical protein ACFLSQ_07425 [Bacteroidota bacterium]
MCCIRWINNGLGKITLKQTITEIGCADSVAQNVIINSLPSAEIVGENEVCAGSSMTYSTPDSTSMTNQWNAIGGIVTDSSNLSNIDILWGNSSSGTVTLRQIDTITGCSNIDYMEVVINPLPSFENIKNQDTVCLNTIAKYIGNIEQNIENYWYVEGGELIGPATGDTIDVLWDGEDYGILKLIAVDTVTNCFDSINIYVKINKIPLEIYDLQDTVCEKTQRSYYCNHDKNIKYHWIVEGGFILNCDTTDFINVLWDSAGTGKIKLIETHTETNCCDSLEKEIIIINNPLPKIIISTVTVCEYNSYFYQANYDSSVSYNWEVVNGVIIGDIASSSITVCWGNTGEGEIILTQTNNFTSCYDSIVKFIKILPKPTPFIIGDTSVIEYQENEYFTKSYSNIDNMWDVSGGEIKGKNNISRISVIWSESGKGWIKLIQTNKAIDCKDSLFKQINIIPEPDIYIQGFEEVCEFITHFYKTSKKLNIENKWYATSGTIIGSDLDSIVQIKWDSAGDGIVKLIKTNTKNGTKDSLSKNINIHSLPEISFEELPDICLKAQSLILN